MKKVLIVSSSLRIGSNSEILAHEVEKGAINAGHDVEFINLKDKDIHFCIGCLSCDKTSKCIHKDDMAEMLPKIQNTDVIVFATPIYYYEMSGKLKTFLDRTSPLFLQKNKFKDVYLVTALHDDRPDMCQAAKKGIEGWIACFPQSRFAGMLDCGGLANPKDIMKHANFLQKAYELGKNI